MVARSIPTALAWLSRRIILIYLLGAALFLSVAGGLVLLDQRGWEDRLLALSPRTTSPHDAERLKGKIREALTVFPGTLAKIGVALLGVAALGGLVRALEDRGESEPASEPESPSRTREPAAMRTLDGLVPIALAALVLVQVAGRISRPLQGDELENYQYHLTLPLKGMLTTMSGANNQLGYTILAWTSMRVFGDSPLTVRLPALLGAMLLPGVVYRVGSRQFGRGGAAVVALLLALWPDTLSAAVQGRSYSLLMVAAILHFSSFERFLAQPTRRAGLGYALTLAAACTLHMWFVVVAGAELVFLGVLKAEDRLGTSLIGRRTPLRVERLLVFLTIGGLCAAVVQAGILPKFLFILTQKNPTAVDARLVLSSMADSLLGRSFDSMDLAYHDARTRALVLQGISVLAMVGIVASALSARRCATARVEIGFFLVLFAVSFLVVDLQKPVYLYPRFFMFLPMLLAWIGARGWGWLLARVVPRALGEAH